MYLNNCGVDDEELATMLEGLGKAKDFTKLYYKQNVFGEESLEALRPLLKKGLVDKATPPASDDEEELKDF